MSKNPQQKPEALTSDCSEKLERVGADLTALAQHRVKMSRDFVNRTLVAMHSVKSAAASLQHAPLKQLSHLAEAVVAEVREGRLVLSSGHVEVLLSATGSMKKMLAQEADQRGDFEFSRDVERLNAILSPQVAKGTNFQPVQRVFRSLVTEDDFACRVLLQGLLSKYGECHIAINGREAIKAFRAARSIGQGYDLLCMDIQMPGIDGREAVAQIRQIERDEQINATGVKILMTTSLRDSRTMLSSFGAKCDDYLVKPVDGRKLLEHLKSLGLVTA